MKNFELFMKPSVYYSFQVVISMAVIEVASKEAILRVLPHCDLVLKQAMLAKVEN